MTERRADEATRNVADWLKCDFMQDHVGETFTGIISSVTGFGFFVRLDDLFIDGLVHVSALDNDYYRFDNVGQRLIGESSGQTYRLGDKVEIRVDAVHMDERKIDLFFFLALVLRVAQAKPRKNARSVPSEKIKHLLVDSVAVVRCRPISNRIVHSVKIKWQAGASRQSRCR